MISATDGAARWAQGFGASGTKWMDGVNSVTTPPGQAAARQKALWVQNTTTAADRWAANTAKVTVQDWQAACQTKGAPRLASGAAAGQSKYETAAAKWYPAIENVVRQLPARGDIEANINRAGAFARAMHALKTG